MGIVVSTCLSLSSVQSTLPSSSINTFLHPVVGEYSRVVRPHRNRREGVAGGQKACEPTKQVESPFRKSVQFGLPCGKNPGLSTDKAPSVCKTCVISRKWSRFRYTDLFMFRARPAPPERLGAIEIVGGGRLGATEIVGRAALGVPGRHRNLAAGLT